MFSFLQLHTSPTYEDKHSLLVHPDDTDAHEKDEESHVFSPILCRGVCDGGQIVWANTRLSAGLTGRAEMPLNTAVGVPLCSIGDDLYIIVLFAVKSILVNPNAIEFLSTLARAVYVGESSGFLPTSVSQPVKPANAELFVGIWDMMDFVKKYSSEIAFHLLPIDRLETFFAYQEASVFKDLLFAKQAAEKIETKKSRSDSVCSYSSQGWATVNNELMMNSEPKNSTKVRGKDSPMPLLEDDSQSFRTVLKQACEESLNNNDTRTTQLSLENSDVSNLNSDNSYPNGPIDVRMSYKKEQSRFHEFMFSMLEMTLFDSAELWLLSDQTNELYVVAALHHHQNLMQLWISQSEDMRLKKGVDIPGYVWEMGRPHWDSNFHTHIDDPLHPRAKTASELNIHTAFGVPLPGPSGFGGVLVLYSMKEIDVSPTMIDFVLRASQLLAATSLDPKTLSYFDIESIVFAPQPKLLDWYSSSSNVTSVQLYNNKTQSDNMRVNFMGSLSNFVWGKKNKKRTAEEIHVASPKRMKDDIDELERRSVDSLLILANNIFEEKPKKTSQKMPKSNSSTNLANLAVEALKHNVPLCSTIGFNKTKKKTNYNGSRKCQFEGCTKCAQGSTQFCISHGGGRRCTVEGCTKAARDKLFCAGHGGGSRCQTVGCSKAAVGGSHLCTFHGGGKRCQVEGCTKSSQSNTMLCVKHGGGRKCQVEGCAKVARGRTDFCAAHGNTVKKV